MATQTFDDATKAVIQHTLERNWDKNSSRSLAISIALEANELLEHYQWKEDSVGNNDELAAELADILIYAIQFAHKNDIDIPTAITKKLAKAAKKYPVEAFAGKDLKERHEAWLEAKKNFKKDTTL